MKSLSKIVLILSLLIPGIISAQMNKSEKIKPQWLHKLPEPSNSTFSYELDPSVGGKSLDEARKTSINGMITSSGFENGVVVVSDYKSKVTDSKTFNNGRLSDIQEDVFVANNKVQGNEVKLNLKRIAEYWEQDKNGNYHLTTLYQKSLNQNPSFDDVELTTKYGAHGLWRSAIVPGWGQFYKGSYLKGGLILGGTVALVGGIIFTENQRADYVNKISKTHSAEIKKSYATKRDHFATGRNICIGAAAALYVYNLIDAIVAPGARRVVVHKRKNGSGYAILPTMTAEGNPALAASITF
ncbi:MAG: hypothetical protein K2I89_07455 [Muribaculaceae bacterium]|nr:hypothetical protein [Muribaculaceae bacterium]